ncbi:chitobiase-like [Ciona intestinalis]
MLRVSLNYKGLVGLCIFSLIIVYYLKDTSHFSKDIKYTMKPMLDYMGANLEVRYKTGPNYGADKFIHEVTIINSGDQDIPHEGWSIYFNSLHLIEFDNLKKKREYSLPLCDFIITHMDGGFFKLTPDQNFKGIPAGGAALIKFRSYQTASRSYILPRWYVSAPDHDPVIILSTDDEDVKFVEDFNKMEKWKRSSDDNADPFTPQERFARDRIEDLVVAPMKVLPTPIHFNVNSKKIIVLDSSKWCMCCTNLPSNIQNEAKRIAGEYAQYIYPGFTWHIHRVKVNIVVLDILGVQHVPGSEPCPPSQVIKIIVADVEGVPSSNEAYLIKIDDSRETIIITAPHEAGIFYAGQTLLSLAERNGSFQLSFPTGTIKDGPRYGYRGLHIDVARNFVPADEIIKIIETMALYKLNKLHFHLTDDEGWRIEINGLPELTQIGAVRCHTEHKTFYVLPRYKEYNLRGDTAAADEFRLIDPDDVSTAMSVQHFRNNALNPCIASSYKFVEKVITEIKALHADIQPLTTMHMGGDEVAKKSWEGSPVCEKFINEEEGFPYSNVDLQEYFIRKVSDICTKHGLNLGVWEDGALKSPDTVPYEKSSIPCDVLAYSWNNAGWSPYLANRAYKLANAGYKVVMSQATHFYFDHPHEPDPEEIGLFWATRYIDDRKVFEFMPEHLYSNAKFNLNAEPFSSEDVKNMQDRNLPLTAPENIIGMQAAVWSEMLRDVTKFHYQLFPRLIAFAERAWHKAPWEAEKANEWTKLQDWRDFVNVVGYKELSRLRIRNIHYRLPPPGVRITDDGKIEICSKFPGLTFKFRTVSGDQHSDWSECVDQQPITDKKATYEFVTTDGQRQSRVIRL